MENQKEFGKLRSIFLPIHKNELRKVIPALSLFCFISMNYALLRTLKDLYVQESINTAAIYVIKLIGTPIAILFTMAYGKVSGFTTRDSRFNLVVGYFLGVFSLFTLCVPFFNVVKPDSFVNSCNQLVPSLSNLWETIRYWPYALFYLHAEAWGTFVLSVLFWTFMNDITGVNQAKRVYSFIAIGAALGTFLAGVILDICKANHDYKLYTILVAIVLVLLIYNLFTNDIKHNPDYYQVVKKKKKKKAQMSFMESLKFLSGSYYLALIAVLVLAYGLIIALFEAVYKDQLNLYALQIKLVDGEIAANAMRTSFYAWMHKLNAISSVAIICMAPAIMKKGWRFAASVTPVISLVMTFCFFSFMFFGKEGSLLADFVGKFGYTPLYMVVWVGVLNAVLIKAVKYVLFDPTKEAAYIPLDEESKIRGKAAVDGAGSRLGKSMGGMVITVLTTLSGIVGCGNEISNVKNIVVAVIFLVIIVWLYAVKKLAVLKHEVEEKHEAELAAEKASDKELA